MFSRSMTAGDAYFHLLLAGCVVGGTLLAQGVGESLWQNHNSGVCTMQKSVASETLPARRQYACCKQHYSLGCRTPASRRRSDHVIPDINR